MARLRSKSVPLLVLSTFACGSPPQAAGPSASASAGAGAPPPSASASAPGPAAPLDAKGAVALHGTIVSLESLVPSPGDKPAQVAFVGTKDAIDSVWVLEDDPTPMVVYEFPAGAKLVGTFERKYGDSPQTLALVQSRAVLDQPAGLHGVASIGASTPIESEARAITFERATDVASATAAAQAAPSLDEDAVKKFLDKASKSKASLTAAFAPAGVDELSTWQGTFLSVDAHLDGKKVPAADLDRMLEIAKAAAREPVCEDSVCDAVDASGRRLGSVVLVPNAGGFAIRGFFGAGAPAAPPASTGAAKSVEASKTTAASERVLAARTDHVESILGEAPLGAPGSTVGVALVGTDRPAAVLVVHDSAFDAVIPLDDFARADLGSGEDASPPVPKFEVRFLDADGDGRTDVLVRSTGNPYGPSEPVSFSEIVAAPRSLRGPDALVVARDQSRDADLLAAKTIDSALEATLRFAAVHTDAKEACALVAKLGTKKGLTANATKDALRWGFEEPGMPTFARASSIQPLATIDDDVAPGLVSSCASLRCDGDAYCWSEEEPPGSTHYWFARDGKKLLLRAIAYYTGS